MRVGSISEDARGIAVGEGSGDDGRGTDVESVQKTRRQQFIEKLPRPCRTSPRISSPVLHVNSSYEVQLAITSNSARLVPRDFSSECKPANSYNPAPAKPGCAGSFFPPETVHGPADVGVSYCSRQCSQGKKAGVLGGIFKESKREKPRVSIWGQKF